MAIYAMNLVNVKRVNMLNHNQKNTYSDALFSHMDYQVDFGEIKELAITPIEVNAEIAPMMAPETETVIVPDFNILKADESESFLPLVPISSSAQAAWDQLASIRLKDKKLNNIRMYFILDEINFNQISQGNLTCFNDEAQNLFLKMSKAMGVDESEFIIAGLNLINETENYDVKALIMDEIDLYAPKGIATFGAKAASLLLGRTERLAKIHGQFLTTRLQNTKDEARLIEWMPLFHPDLLLINPNMKKTAWVDMQKLMLRF